MRRNPRRARRQHDDETAEERAHSARLVCRAPHAGQAAICWTSCRRWGTSWTRAQSCRASPDAAAPMATKPWDSRLAHALILPLRDTRVHPNHVTTAALLTGLGGRRAVRRRPPASRPISAPRCWVLASILDHADGELARLTGKVSEFGHRYDRAADLIVKLSLFAGMGASLRHGPLQQLGTSARRARRGVAARDLSAARRDGAAPRRWRVQAADASAASSSRTSCT